jgi:MYXO-CTERM domain-containing protein
MLTIRSRASLALSLALLASLCASQAAAQARVPTHVACVGDSITYGLMASSPAASYPSVLQNLMGSSVQVSNFGHSGATMMSVADQPYQNTAEYTAATTFVSGAGASAVVDVIIMLGTNDSKSYNWMVGTGTRAQQFVTDCGAMVDHFASLPTHPLVYLAFPPRAFANTYGIDGTIIHDQMLPLIQQVATAKGIPIIDVDTPTAPHPELFPDGVHPNDTGYALVAQVMYDGLQASSGAGGSGGQGGASGQGGVSGQGGASGQSGTASGGRGGAGGTSAAGGHGGAGQGGGSAGTTGAGGATANGGRGGAGEGGGQGGATVAGGTSGSGVAGTSGVSTGGAHGGAGDAMATGGSGSGCSCRLADAQPAGGVGLSFVALALVLRSRRRRARDQ